VLARLIELAIEPGTGIVHEPPDLIDDRLLVRIVLRVERRRVCLSGLVSEAGRLDPSPQVVERWSSEHGRYRLTARACPVRRTG
jgi:hypothetical protein